MATEVYEDHGVRFEYPSDWAVEATEEDDVTTVDLQHPEGVAFVLVRIDESCRTPRRPPTWLSRRCARSIPSSMTLP